MKRIFASLLIVMSLLSVSVPAYAQSVDKTVTVTVQKGDTICSICSKLDLSFKACKSTIMNLNNMKSEAELDSICAGTKLIFPAENPTVETGGDQVEYYVIRYIMEKGNWLANVYYCWGLDYEDYIDDIKGLNGISNLDKIYIGSSLLLPTTAENLQNDQYTTVMGHVMGSGETAYSVCQEYGLDYYAVEEKLVKYNFGADLTKLQVGQKLLIPID